ncbi:hypothetical protein M9458_030289 [Cirrhinus mrigala]|uniref:Gypsy retrotransposon integrase-like protein 1 n=1 Tax=Cirrhinus mrigala TaxID=683832 RepID=A0ABD0PLL3_CIRMR
MKWFERYRIASGLDKQSQEYQVNTFMYAAGEDAEEISYVLPLTEEEKKSYAAVTEAFNKHCVSKRNIIFERARFNKRNQELGESIESFITVVHSLTELCDFGALKEDLIRDRIAKLSESLQLDADLTLEKAITRVRQSAAVKKQQPILRGAEQPTGHMVSIHRKDRKMQAAFKRKTENHSSECGRCGNLKKHHWKDCPARDADCRKCCRKGHFAKKFKSTRGVNDITERQVETKEEDDFAFLREVYPQENDGWNELIRLNGVNTVFKLDTGAAVTAIPSCSFTIQQHGVLHATGKVLFGPGNHKLDVKGRFKGQLSVKDKTTEQDIYVVAGLSKPLLGLPAIEALTLIQRLYTVHERQDDIRTQYPSVFSGLGKLNEPYTIELEPTAVPYALSSPRRVPLPMRDKVRAELKHMEDMGVISKVTQPTPWCAGMVIVPKAQGKIRLCVNLTHLNKWVRRERQILPAVDQTIAMLAGAKVFIKLDATSGFWQIPLSQESKLLTTFITPFGRYAFNRLPFGISSAPEHFQRRISQMLEGCEGVVCHADDILVYGEDMHSHNVRLHGVLKRLQEEGLTLNEKCVFAADNIMFVGHHITAERVAPDPGKVRAIMEMPEPTGVEGVRRLLGMDNYLGKFLPHLASYTRPLKDLLSEKNEWCWGIPQMEAFQKLKVELSSHRMLASYSLSAETRVAADASSFGLGGVLSQKQGLSEAEKHYAQIEKEALAYRLETDHKPLLSLLSTKALDELPPRILRFRLRLIKFRFDIVHVPGKQLITADTLSRAPVKHTFTQEEKEDEDDVKVFVDAVVQALPATDARLNTIIKNQKADPICAKLIQYRETEWSEKHVLPPELGPYWPERENLTVAGELHLRGQRIVIPHCMRQEILHKIHDGHQGIVKCRARARQAVWWPGLSVHISQLVETCSTCSQHRAEHRGPLLTTPVSERPWQRVGTDLFFWEKTTYLLVVDYFSRYIEVARLNVATANTVIAALKDVFSRHGIPETVMSDNGPQYSCALFKNFASDYRFTHITSSPRYPQANGEAERAVATVKGLCKGGEEKTKALLTYRATPLENGYSPAQLLMGRALRTTIPQLPTVLNPRWPKIKGFRKSERRAKEKQRCRYDMRYRARPLPILEPGQRVWLPREESQGTVIRPAETPRSYVVHTDEGLLRRNRTHMRAVYPTQYQKPTETRDTTRDTGNTDNQTHTTGDMDKSRDIEGGRGPYVANSGRVSRPPERLDL